MKGDKMPEAKETTKEEQPKTTPKSSSGLEPNIAALLAYLLEIVGLIFFFIEKDNEFVRFAAMQSFILSIAFWAVYWLFGVVTLGFGFLLTPLLGLAYLVIRVMLMIKAYNNEMWELPVIGSIAKNAIK